MASGKLLKNLRGELPILIVLSPIIIVFCLLCWLCAHYISWLGVIFGLVGAHWILTRDPPALSPTEASKRQSVRVIIVGAGYSGLCMAIKLRAAGIPFVILEKSSTLGGTWYDNTYPGCACDIMSHLYSFSFFPNPFWSTSFPSQPEILAYLKRVADHYCLLPDIRFGVRVDKCRWDAAAGAWTVISVAGESFVGNFLISGIGALHVPKTPDFPGRNDFSGVSFHTAEWDHGFDYAGKDVAVVGTGASAVQTVPAIVGKVKSLAVFQRTAVWTAPRLDFAYPRLIQAAFNAFPLLMKLHRWYIFFRQELNFFVNFGKGTERGKHARRLVTHFMRSQIHDPILKEKLIPNFPMGCKRITVSNDYVASFNSPNARLVTDKIARIVPEGIVVRKAPGEAALAEETTTAAAEKAAAAIIEEEELLRFDAIIYATGFDLMASCKNMVVEGKDGVLLDEYWGESPNAYLGISCPNFPNLFYLLGPNVGLGHNSVVWMIECQVTYCIDAILKCVNAGIKSIDIDTNKNRDYQGFIQSLMKLRVFHDGCKSWYQNSEGIVFALWPSHLLHYWWLTKKCDLNNYIVE